MTKKYTIEEYQTVGQYFYDKLRFLTFPVTIKYIYDHSEIPDLTGIIQPSKINQKITLCRAYSIVRCWGDNSYEIRR